MNQSSAWWARLTPGATVLRGYQRAWLRPELVAGLTVGAMLVPQAMAYAELAGMPPSFGFNAVFLPLLAYALVGTSRHLGVGPEPGTAILAAAGVGALVPGDTARYFSLMATLAALVGLLALLGALLRLGFLAELLSKPVLVGYITGVALTLLSSQLGKATGVTIRADGFFPRVLQLTSRIGEVKPVTVAMTLGTLVILLALRRFAPKIPGALIGVAIATGISEALHLPAQGLRTVGQISATLPSLALPTMGWADVVSLLPTALAIVMVGYTDNVLTARSVAAKRGYRIDPNQEMLALGAINLGSALSGGFPVSSSASRTAVPAALGSKSQLTSIIAVFFVGGALFGLTSLLERMPEAALAAVIMSAALAIIDVQGFRRLWTTARWELAIAVAGTVAVMLFDVLGGVLVAVAASVLLALARIAVPHDSVLAHAEGQGGWVDADRYGLAPTAGLLVYRFDAPLFFANAARFRERVMQMLEKNPGSEEWLVLDFSAVGEVDASSLEMLEELTRELSSQGLVVAIARANGAVCKRLERAELVAPKGELRIYPTIANAVRAFGERSPKESS